jgi:hypothetical protein
MLTKRRLEWNREKKQRLRRLLGASAHGRKKRREKRRHNREK